MAQPQQTNMATLRDKNKQIPGGFKFRQAETGWTAPQWQSFEVGVRALITHRLGNMALVRKHNWATDYASVAFEFEAYNAKLCEAQGWTEYILQPSAEAPPPKFKALSPFTGKQLSAVADKIKKVWQGVRSLNDWLESGESAVDATLSQHRAEGCVKCPLNGKGGLEEWFTKPAADIIKRQFDKMNARKLSTSLDEKLGVCQACLCPLKLLVHVPLDFKLAHMGKETRRALDPGCWVLSEEKDTKF